MHKPFFHYVGHLIAIEHTVHTTDALDSLFVQGVESVGTLLTEIITTLNQIKEALPDNRVAEHEVHIACGEVEMWMEAIRLQFEPHYESDSVDSVMGSDIHGSNHTLTVIAQAVRLLELLRGANNLIDALGGAQRTKDLINRGWTLLSRLYSSLKYVTQTPETDYYKAKLEDFFEALNQACLHSDPNIVSQLILAGYLPPGAGLPLGGSGFSIELHKFAQGSKPDPSAKAPTSGWSVGRNGGNKENIGGGRMDPTYS